MVVVVAAISCRNQPSVPENETGRLRHSFELPEEVNQIAPRMQAHLYRLLPFNGAAHKVKPEFVFIDGEQQRKGRLNMKINHLDMLHLAYHQNGHPVWNGSLLVGAGNGMAAVSERGYVIGLKRVGDDYEFRFTDGEDQFTSRFVRAESHRGWLEGDRGRLYLYYYVFPASLTAGQAMGFGGVLPPEQVEDKPQP